MGKYAVVLDGVVINIVVWDGVSDWKPSDGDAVECTPEVSIGWLYNGSVFTDPNTSTPPSNAEVYKREFESLNKKYLSDIGDLSTAWGNAGLFDGPSEATKKTQLQNQANVVKSKYQTDIAALKEKYGA